MDRDRSLLFAAFCLQAGRIDSEQFATACRICAERPDTPLDELLVERGWIQPADRPHLEYLVDRHVRFEIALDTAQKRGIRLSSRLLSVAHRVRP